MKTILICMLTLSLSAMEEDKKAHAVAGAIISGTVYVGSYLVAPDAKPWQRFLAASLAATAAGWAKELYDRQGHGTYESRDAWTTAAGGTGTAGILFVVEVSF